MSNYHNRIMNIQATRVKEFRPQHISYKEGHRDARHAAAEIAIEAEREIEELREKNSELLYIIHELYAMGFLTETFDSGCDHRAVCRKAHKLLKD